MAKIEFRLSKGKLDSETMLHLYTLNNATFDAKNVNISTMRFVNQ